MLFFFFYRVSALESSGWHFQFGKLHSPTCTFWIIFLSKTVHGFSISISILFSLCDMHRFTKGLLLPPWSIPWARWTTRWFCWMRSINSHAMPCLIHLAPCWNSWIRSRIIPSRRWWCWFCQTSRFKGMNQQQFTWVNLVMVAWSSISYVFSGGPLHQHPLWPFEGGGVFIAIQKGEGLNSCGPGRYSSFAPATSWTPLTGLCWTAWRHFREMMKMLPQMADITASKKGIYDDIWWCWYHPKFLALGINWPCIASWQELSFGSVLARLSV